MTDQELRYADTERSLPARKKPAPTSPGPAPLGGWLTLLAVGTLLVGSCSGLMTGGEAAMHASTLEGAASGKTSMSYSFSAGSKQANVPVDATATGRILRTGLIFRSIYVLACLAAAILAGFVLSKATGFNPRALLGYAAAALAALRLVLAGLDYAMVEASMEAARNQLRNMSGYSYNRVGTALNQAEDVGTSGLMALGVAVAVFWIATAVSYWGARSAEE